MDAFEGWEGRRRAGRWWLCVCVGGGGGGGASKSNRSSFPQRKEVLWLVVLGVRNDIGCFVVPVYNLL